MRAEMVFEPHLVINEITVPRSGQWTPNSRNCLCLYVKAGVGYWQQPDEVRELSTGSVLVFAREAKGHLLASQLNDVVISYFSMDPEKLIGFLSLNEMHSLKRTTSRENSSAVLLAPGSPISERFRNLCLNRNAASLLSRLSMVQLFFEVFQCEVANDPMDSTQEMDGRERLRRSLNRMAASEFVGLSLSDLVPQMRCSRRHLSRLFLEEVGTPFREKQTELRLAKACQVLAASNAKLVEVALISGYRSYSLFADLFKKRFGLSPAKWRQRYGSKVTRRQKYSRLLAL